MAIKIRIMGVACVLLNACTLGPDFTAPHSDTPESWFRPSSGPRTQPSVAVEGETIDAKWWGHLHDSLLNDLVGRIATQNFDVLTASARIEESRAQMGINASQLYPKLQGDASYNREKLSDKGVISLVSGGAAGAGGGSGAGIPSMTTTPPFNVYQYGFDVSWEIDLWGRVRRGVEAAGANLEATEEAHHATMISTIAELVRDYVQLRGTQATLETLHKQLDIAREIVKLVEDRAKAGLSSDVDLANARAQVASVAAQLPQMEQQQAALMNAVALLLGAPPGALEFELAAPHPVPPVPPRVPIGVPSELTERRPDIRQAEAQLHAATAEIGVAKAEFFPRVTLMGNGMLQSLSLNTLNEWAAHSYTFGPYVSLPIFEGGQLVSNLDLHEAVQREAALQYRKTVLTAFHEVDNALTAFHTEQDRRNALIEAQDQDRHALDLDIDRYKKGLADFLNVLNGEQNLLAIEQQTIQSNATVTVNMVELYKALGGGWEVN